MSWNRIALASLPLVVPIGLLSVFVGGTLWPVAPFAVIEIGLVVLARRSSRAPSEPAWSAVPTAAGRRSLDETIGSVPVALARVEIRELLLSGWFQAGVGFCVLLSVGVTSFERGWWSSAALVPLLVHPLCGLTIVAVHRNVTRARRDGAEELFESCPGTAADRRLAHLFGAVVPIIVGVLFVVGILVGSGLMLDMYGPIDVRVVSDATIAALLLPAGAVALGVAVGRRFPFALAPFVMLGLILAVNTEFWDEPDGRGWLATGTPSTELDAVFVQPPVAGRLLWFAGLVTLVVGLAVWAGRRSRSAMVALGGSLAAVAGIVVSALPPDDTTVERLAGYVTAAPEHTTCPHVTSDVELCAPTPYRGHASSLALDLQPVAAAIPGGVLAEPLRLGFRVEDTDLLQGRVRRAVAAEVAPDPAVGLPFGHHDVHRREARFELAAAAVRVPTDDTDPGAGLVNGQARGVVLLWLAVAGLPRDDALEILEPERTGTPTERGDIWPSYCGTPVQWAPQDLDAARRLLDAGANRVTPVLAARWTRWLDPTTATDELLAAVGVPPVGAPDPIDDLGATC